MKVIVALITGHMSFRTYAPPAFEGKALLSDPTVIKWQLRFVKYFVSRFKNEEVIVGWDLGNEVANMPGITSNPDSFYLWCAAISDAIRSCDGKRPVISGLDGASAEAGAKNLRTVGELCDAHTVHPYPIFSAPNDPLPTMKPILDIPFSCAFGEGVGGVPTFVQEFGATGYMNCSYKTEADFYRCSMLTSLAHGCHGTMWWCAFDQGHLNVAPYRWNNIGSNYGFFDKDGAAKPVAEENKRFAALLAGLPEGKLPPHRKNAVLLVPRDDGLDMGELRAAYILAKQANLDLSVSYVLDPLPDAPLYIFPSVTRHKAITRERLDELMEKVAAGAVLYLSTDTGLLRDFPDVTGVTVAYREQLDAMKQVRFGEYTLPIKATAFLMPEKCEGEVLATDEEGNGVFFSHVHGKGKVFTLTLPLEKQLAGEKGAFFRAGKPPYDVIYRRLAKEAGILRTADSSHPFVRLTEHPSEDGSLYLFAINYHKTPLTARITFTENYTVQTVFGNDIEDGVLTLRENDGALFKLTKR